MSRTIYSWAFFAIVALCGCSSRDAITDIAAYLEELEADERYSGVVLIAKDGDPIFEGAYGIANRNYGVPNEVDTKFNLGSMNKMFTGVAILQLAKQGRLSVDDTVIEHIPGYPNQEAAEAVTIHQLLTHTSGMGDFLSQEFRDHSKDQYREHEDYLPLFVDKPLIFEPGARGYYSNAGFIVLGLIIEEVAGQTYFDYVRENIYGPCGMMDTDSYEVDRVVPNIAVGYAGFIRDYRSLASNVYFLPFKGVSAGGGYSTAGDLLKFSNCLMTHQLLSSEWTDVLLEGKVDSPVPGMEGMYGYGFRDSEIYGHRVVGHGGSMPGVCSNLDIYPDLGLTVVVLSNSSHDCTRVIIKTREALLN